MSARGDLNKLIRRARRLGLQYEHGGKHPRLVEPKSGRYVVLSGTPSCPFAANHVRADLKKYLSIIV